MKHSKIIFAFLLLSCTVLFAQTDKNILQNGGAETGLRYWGRVKLTDKDFYSGKYCFELALKRSRQTVAPWYIVKIDPAKKYSFSGQFKSIGSAPCKVAILMNFCDKFMHGFSYYSIHIRKGTETELIAPVKAGDTVLKVKDASTWPTAPYFGVAFRVDVSGKYNDVPNHNLSLAGIKSVKRTTGYWQVTLNKALRKPYPTGCKVRVHRVGPYHKAVVPYTTIPDKWTKLGFNFQGVRKLFEPTGNNSINKLWPCTKYIGIQIIVKGTPGKSKLLLDDLNLTAN
jgi:hypothetical protein